MNLPGEHNAAIRRSLAILLAFESLNAFGGGIYGLMGAKAIPKEWLKGSPFHSYFIPSLILILAVGGACLKAAVAVQIQARNAQMLAFSAGIILLGWIAAQLALIGYVSWLQPETVLVGIAILILTWRLPPA